MVLTHTMYFWLLLQILPVLLETGFVVQGHIRIKPSKMPMKEGDGVIWSQLLSKSITHSIGPRKCQMWIWLFHWGIFFSDDLKMLRLQFLLKTPPSGLVGWPWESGLTLRAVQRTAWLTTACPLKRRVVEWLDTLVFFLSKTCYKEHLM